MFKEEREKPKFELEMIGDIGLGRPNLGPTTGVAAYRMMQFTLRDVMIQRLGVEATERIFYEAGELAGREFCRALVSPADDLNSFLREVQELLQKYKIGILRIESIDENQKITLTVSEDLDCSGLKACDETICTYDEGFLSGLLGQHTGIEFEAREVDCWCSGGNTCRFEVEPAD